jgi:glycerol uptake facilitator protein
MAVIWLLGAVLAINAVGNISGAHLNPAVSLAFAVVRPHAFGWKKVLPYWGAQLLGATIAGALNLAIFYSAIEGFEAENGLKRGSGDSIRSASTFGDYWR